MADVLGRYLTRPPRYGIGAAAVPYRPDLPTYIRITDIDDNGRFSPNPRVSVDSILSDNYELTPGDLVIARTGASVGKSYRYRVEDGELVFAGFLIGIHPDDRQLDPRYLAFFLQSKVYWDWVASESMRSGQPGINAQQLSRLSIQPPRIEDQREVADKLADVDALAASLEQVVAKKRALKQGMMQELLTGRTRLSGFDGEWEDVSAGDTGVFKGGSGFPTRFQGLRGQRYPFFKVSDMNNLGNETYMRSSNNSVSEPMRSQLGATAFPAGSIVFAKVGAAVFLERKRILAEPSCIDNNMAAFTANATWADSLFMYYVLQSVQLGSLVAVGALPSLNGRQLRSIPVCLPRDINEQKAIAGALRDADAEIAALERRLETARAIKQGMMQELLTGRTRLVPTEASA